MHVLVARAPSLQLSRGFGVYHKDLEEKPMYFSLHLGHFFRWVATVILGAL